MPEETPKCPQCGAEMRLRESYRGKFFGCSKFPECRATIDYAGEKEKCETCGSDMVLKNGKNGRFYSCSKYPECKTTKEYKELCPKCGGEMSKRKGANGDFWGCLKYPECKGTRNIGKSAFDKLKEADSSSPAKEPGAPNDTGDYGGGNENPF